jgi:hypothetical protein
MHSVYCSIIQHKEDREKEEEIAAQEAQDDAAQQEMENDLMMQNEMDAEIDMALNDAAEIANWKEPVNTVFFF